MILCRFRPGSGRSFNFDLYFDRKQVFWFGLWDLRRFGVMDVTKPYEFIGFWAMDVTKPYEFIGFGANVRTVRGDLA